MDFSAWLLIAATAAGFAGHGILALILIVVAFWAMERYN